MRLRALISSLFFHSLSQSATPPLAHHFELSGFGDYDEALLFGLVFLFNLSAECVSRIPGSPEPLGATRIFPGLSEGEMHRAFLMVLLHPAESVSLFR